MRPNPTRFLLALLTLLAATACEFPEHIDEAAGGGGEEPGGEVDGEPEDPSPAEPGQMWIANRADRTLSIIDVATDTVLDTLAMPDDGEPMYVNFAQADTVVFVGDRANNRVVIFDAETRAVLGTAPAGAGVFHQWTQPNGAQLWVNNDVDRTTTVIDTTTYAVRATIAMPADLAGMPGTDGAPPKPHDVLVAPDGSAAFVSYLGFDGPHDYVVRFDTTTFAETHRITVGKDPHLSATSDNDLLYVPCQGTDEVIVLGRADLRPVTRVALPGAHGAGMAHGGDHFYVTNLPADGAMALFVIDTATHALVSDSGVDAPMNGKPHNVAVAGDDRKVYVTHSGPDADIVSVYAVSPESPVPAGALMQITVGRNPFGLGFVPVSSAAPAVRYKRLFLDVSDLGTLRDGHHYEAWAIFDGQPVSVGKFNVDASGVATDVEGIAIMDGLFNAGRDLSVAEALVITIEVPGDIDIVPNETHYVAGDIAGLGATLTVGHPAALGTDFADAMGMFILATPTDGPDTHETSGVWFINLQMADPQPGLALPDLPAGWYYEGWAVIDGQPVSTGKFRAVDAADDAAPYSGDEPAPPFPGEDFLRDAPDGLAFPTDLSGVTMVISVEPEPDDSALPFLLKPLVGAAPANANHHQTFYMDNNAASLPVVTAILKE